MNSIQLIASDPSRTGHTLAKPVVWIGREISKIFTTPLPEQNKAREIAERVVIFVGLLALSATLVIVIPFALANLAIKHLRSSGQRAPQPPIAPPIPPPAPLSAALIEEAQQEAARLKNLYDDLKDLNSKSAKELFEGVERFKQKLDSYRRDPFALETLSKPFALIDHLKPNTDGMQAALRFWTEEEARKDVVFQPGDGNCWLHTTLLGLTHLNHSERREHTPLTLRPLVIDWIQAHYQSDQTLRNFLQDSLEAHKFKVAQALQQELESLNNLLTENFIPENEISNAIARREEVTKSLTVANELTLNDYYIYIREDRSHGSQAELYAISRIFRVNIVIWREVAPSAEFRRGRLTNEYDAPFLIDNPQGTINVVMARSGDHFNYRLPLRNAS